MRISKVIMRVFCIVVMTGLAFAGHIAGDDAFAKLMEGNKPKLSIRDAKGIWLADQKPGIYPKAL